MHCPKCGDPFASDDARFCRRCGFEITGVKEFLTTEISETKKAHARQTSFKQAMGITIACLIAIFINILLRDAFSIPPIYGKLIIVMLMGLAVLKLMMSGGVEKKLRVAKSQGLSAPTTKELEPPQEYLSDLQALNYVERLAPPSVTESTTRLLDERDTDGVALADRNTDN